MNKKGVTLVELLVALVISAVILAGVYRLFVSQSKAYVVQDQVVEIQQNIRGAMEILLRDLRMAGFDNDQTSDVVITNSVIAGDHSITVRYEHNSVQRDVGYLMDGASRLLRQVTENGVASTEPLLENVEALNFAYGVDYDAAGNEDGAVDYWENSAANISGRKVVAVRVTLTAKPDMINPDLQNVSPRTLASTITFRNLAR